ncbi:hypothetical protein EC844_101235 [Acinetobacter calcoaceticus]|uniref:PilC beta-propeller domain-containing protein n=1 Tax=Acinetobacter calcoaceticus TaxID=471 RepID=A0A4R1Y5J7_ACICA|nr:hypothetical protein EC844_101235 [Acinetobacter calcoaceticus]
MKNINQINKPNPGMGQRCVATCSVLVAVMLGGLSISHSLASDIEIYKNGKPGEVVITMMLDTSASMDLKTMLAMKGRIGEQERFKPCDAPADIVFDRDKASIDEWDQSRNYTVNSCKDDNGQVYYDRISRLKNALYELATSTAIPPSTKIGIGTYPYFNQAKNDTAQRAYMRIAAEPWGPVGSAQRKKVLQLIRDPKFVGLGGTPTSSAYAEAAAYMLGTTTKQTPFSGINLADKTYSPNMVLGRYDDEKRYVSPIKKIGNSQCDGQGIYFMTDGEPQSIKGANILSPMASALNVYESSISPNSGLRGGVSMTKSGYTSHWGEIGTFARYLNNRQMMNKLLINKPDSRLRTAVVGYGSIFDVDPKLRQRLTDPKNQRTRTYYDCNKLSSVDARNTCNWGSKSQFSDGSSTIRGIGGYGEGGFYSANSTQDLIESIVNFIEDTQPDFDPILMGSPTIPVDSLNPIQLHPFGYYATLIPKPDTGQQLWQGNFNKFHVYQGELYSGDKLTRLIKASGEADKNAQGIWGKEGMRGKLPLIVADTESDAEATSQRKIYTNRRWDQTLNKYVAAATLQSITVQQLLNPAEDSQKDEYKNYWLNLLGFKVDEQAEIRQLSQLPKMELRQLGAILHSKPILLTQEGKVINNNGKISTTNREDYLLFGSTQGLLHLLDDQGKEVFSFVPYEMLQSQKQAFLAAESTTGGVQKLFYGVDAPWVARTHYVSKQDGTQTVKITDQVKSIGTESMLSQGLQWVYGGLRMGGKSYYALDLADISKPEFKFQIDPEQQRIISAEHGKAQTSEQIGALKWMGQSWSKPSLAYINWEGTRKLVMFVGGGYDAQGQVQCTTTTKREAQLSNDDPLSRYNNQGYECPTYQQSNGIGAGVYMFDANNGQLLWWASRQSMVNGRIEKMGAQQASYHENLQYSVVSQINSIDRDNDGLVDALYFGDLGGQVFRIDLNNRAANSADFATRIFRLYNGHLNNGLSPRFYEMPSFSVHLDEQNKLFGVVALSSGNVSSPLAGPEISALDGVFVLFDNDIARTDLLSTQQFYNRQDITGLPLLDLQRGMVRGTRLYNQAVFNAGWWHPYSKKRGEYKGLSEIFALDHILYANVYHRDGKGIGDGCGPRVEGDSYLFQFCLPFGKCNFGLNNVHAPDRVKIGAGILGTGLAQGYSGIKGSLSMLLNRQRVQGNCKRLEDSNLPECQLYKTEMAIRSLRWFEQRPES